MASYQRPATTLDPQSLGQACVGLHDNGHRPLLSGSTAGTLKAPNRHGFPVIITVLTPCPTLLPEHWHSWPRATSSPAPLVSLVFTSSLAVPTLVQGWILIISPYFLSSHQSASLIRHQLLQVAFRLIQVLNSGEGLKFFLVCHPQCAGLGLQSCPYHHWRRTTAGLRISSSKRILCFFIKVSFTMASLIPYTSNNVETNKIQQNYAQGMILWS